MQNINAEYVKSFAEISKKLYQIFFKRYPVFKPLALNVVVNSSDNYGLVIYEGERALSSFSIYGSSAGITVDSEIAEEINVVIKLQKKWIQDIVNNGERYLNKPYQLMKYLFVLTRAVEIKSSAFYDIELKGKRVVLRPGYDSDVSYLLKWYNDYDLNRLAGWSSSKATVAKLKYNMSKSFGYDPMNLMIDNEDSIPIGTIQLYDFNEQDKSCKLGIRIGDKNCWGKGYGEDAVNTILDYAFTKLDMYRVALRVYEYNGRAIRCYEKCGFHHEGRSRQSAFIDGTYYDEVLMAILKSDYISRKLHEKRT